MHISRFAISCDVYNSKLNIKIHLDTIFYQYLIFMNMTDIKENVHNL